MCKIEFVERAPGPECPRRRLTSRPRGHGEVPPTPRPYQGPCRLAPARTAYIADPTPPQVRVVGSQTTNGSHWEPPAEIQFSHLGLVGGPSHRW